MLNISNAALDGFRRDQAQRLARDILATAPAMGSLDVAQRYVDEALAVGIETDRDIAEFALLLFPVDRVGRPDHIHALVADPQTGGHLKVFQISYALHGERP